MNGHIWIESEGIGKGCRVTFIVKLGIPNRENEFEAPHDETLGNHGSTINTPLLGLKFPHG